MTMDHEDKSLEFNRCPICQKLPQVTTTSDGTVYLECHRFIGPGKDLNDAIRTWVALVKFVKSSDYWTRT